MSLIVRDTPYGKGVFTTTPISAGTHLLRFTGPFLRYSQTTPQTYALQVGPDLYIGASSGLDDYVNHSCDPNAGFFITGEGENTIADLHAIRQIEPEEQITFDYSTTLDEDDFEFDCLCGSALCRGRIRDGKYLPDPTWNKYLALKILPAYVINSRVRKSESSTKHP